MVGIVVIAFIISRQIIKPLQQLSHLATQFSTDISTPSIEIKGPVEIQQTADAFNKMQARIDRFVYQRMQMIAAISHDPA